MLDAIVIGAGPAGLAAALYLRRYHRRVRSIDAGRSRALWIDRSHNVPGFPQGIGGAELLMRQRQQLAQAGGEVQVGQVLALRREPAGFCAVLDGDGMARARVVLLATGVVDGVPRLPGIDRLRRLGRLRQCPICDAHEHTGRRLLVIGPTADDAHALREAQFLCHYSDRVRVVGLARSEGAPVAVVRLMDAPPMEPGTDAAGFVAVLDDGQQVTFDVAYAALGTQPQSALAASLGARLDELGAIRTDAHGRTTASRLYAAGDVVRALDQISVAVGQGAVAATSIHNSL
jgi:thioredoxin reductase (NADPH)